jgi:hypothetical protein
MSDSLQRPDDATRTGEFYFQVWRQDGEAWRWRLRIEALGTGELETFESMQEALWFIRQHLIVEEDAEGDELLPEGDNGGLWLESQEEPDGEPDRMLAPADV